MVDPASTPKFDPCKRFSAFAVNPMLDPDTGEQMRDCCNTPMWMVGCHVYDAQGERERKPVWVEAPHGGNLEVAHSLVHEAEGDEPEAFFTGVRFSRMLDLPEPHLEPVFRAEDVAIDCKPFDPEDC